jgi:glycosyltransferase involved in cell wall biosynthesis
MLRKEEVDIVQTYFFDANVVGIIAAKLANIKKIVSCRRDMGFWYTGENLRFLGFISRFVDRFQVNSNAIGENLTRTEKISSNRIDVLYNGIDLARFTSNRTNSRVVREKFGIPENHIVFGCLANLNRQVKRVDVFIEAASLIDKKLKDATYLIVGDGHLRVGLELLAKERGIADKTVFAGKQNDVPWVLSAIDIGVLPSDSEGLSNAILEYMASGLPVVATDVGGNRELIQDGLTGFLVPPGNPVRLAEAMVRLATDGIAAGTMAKNARETVERRFAMERMLESVERYYHGLVASEISA